MLVEPCTKHAEVVLQHGLPFAVIQGRGRMERGHYGKVARLVEATTWARGSNEAREMFDNAARCFCLEDDVEMNAVYESLREERNNIWEEDDK